MRVILQQLSGDDINAENFTYEIETANGLMAHHNGLLDDPKITYHPWKQGYGTGGIILDPDNVTDIGKPANVKVAVADLTVARLITDEETILTVYRPAAAESLPASRSSITPYSLKATMTDP